jgi:hypothetical protein
MAEKYDMLAAYSAMDAEKLKVQRYKNSRYESDLLMGIYPLQAGIRKITSIRSRELNRGSLLSKV